MLTSWLEDADVTLYHGDVLQVLRELPAESVDCCVTSPPYWGLRDYGTGAWEGGDEGCDHQRQSAVSRESSGLDGAATTQGGTYAWGATCGKCGATRIDQQLGLESTPEEYVTRMVEVFREVRRVLAPHGTVWLNLGDSYAGSGKGPSNDSPLDRPYRQMSNVAAAPNRWLSVPQGLKPKDLVGIPWRVAFALQADGWYLRSDIIWAKPNPMPESVTDRPTKAHEYVFLLSKQPRYFFDAEAVREPSDPNSPFWRSHPNGQRAISRTTRLDGSNEAAPNTWLRDLPPITDRRPQEETLDGSDGEAPRGPDGRRKTTVQGADGSIQHRDGERWPNGGRNIRSVWEIATQPYPEAHFATFPEELARRCIAAGTSERGKCPECGAPWVRVVERSFVPQADVANSPALTRRNLDASSGLEGTPRGSLDVQTLGWNTSCDCEHPIADGITAPTPAVVLDPFMGSGTVAHVARKLGRHAVGIDLNESYLALAARRLQQQSLFAGSV